MTNKKNIGIWMDHSHAHLMELSRNVIISNIIKSEFTHDEKERSLRKNEHIMHTMEQHLQFNYYKKISDDIRDAKEVVLFGPTTAKSELHNLLKANHDFENIKIVLKQTDKMTENEQCDFVRSYFQSALN